MFRKEWRPILSKYLRHGDAVTFHTVFQRTRGSSCFCAGLDIPQLAIKRRQIRTQAEDNNIHMLTAVLTAIIFGGLDHHASQARALPRRINRQHAEISALAAQFGINCSDNPPLPLTTARFFSDPIPPS